MFPVDGLNHYDKTFFVNLMISVGTGGLAAQFRLSERPVRTAIQQSGLPDA
jgi:hypothetical protein